MKEQLVYGETNVSARVYPNDDRGRNGAHGPNGMTYVSWRV